MKRLRLRALGPISASVIGVEPSVPVTPPRLLSLLVYLVFARPRGHHSRDTLVALLWPESDDASGRQGLRNALHRIRTMAGDGVIVSRGESLVGVDPALIDSDVIEFERAVDEKRWDDALSAYAGELLQGFHVSGAPEFEQWVDGERRRLTNLAVLAAERAAEARQAAGELSGAISAAHRACSLQPDNERSFRHYLALLIASGDRTSAHRAYETFAQRLQAEFGVSPSAETFAALRMSSAGLQNIADPPAQAASVVQAAAEPSTVQERALPARISKRWWLLAAALVTVVAIPAGYLTARARPAAAVPSTAIGAELPARWRSDTILLGRYLRAKALLANRQPAAARDSFLRLASHAPLYAPAWAGLGLTTYRSAFEDIPSAAAFPRATAAALRALALDSTLAVAHEVLVASALWGAWNIDSARKLLDRALVMHPHDAELRNLLATWHRWRGDFDASLALKRENADSDPLSTRAVYQIVPSLYFAHRCEEAVVPFRRLPDEIKRIVGDHILYRSLVCAGYPEEAAEVLREQAIREGDSAVPASFTREMNPGQRAKFTDAILRNRLTREFERRRHAWRPPERIMVSYADRRLADSTLAWLDSMLVERSMMLYVVPFDPLMDFLRNDPRFDAFLRRLPWLASLDDRPRRLIDSLRVRASR